MASSIEVKQFGTVGVLMGGCSSEKAISLKSGKAVCEALRAAGCVIKEIVIESEDAKQNRPRITEAAIDIAFIAMHGHYGEDGGIQSLLEEMGICYVGSDAAASRKAIDKVVTQECFRKAGLPIPDFWVLSRSHREVPVAVEQLLASGAAVVVKPASQGSSIGVHIVRRREELDAALADAFGYDERLLVDRFIRGRELTVGILEDRALPIVEIKPTHAFFDFEAKYQKGLTEYIVPAPLDSSVAAALQKDALNAFRVLGCRDFSRVDFILDEKNQGYILEINTIPGFTGTSLLPMAARCAGYEFSQLCVTLIANALKRRA